MKREKRGRFFGFNICITLLITFIICALTVTAGGIVCDEGYTLNSGVANERDCTVNNAQFSIDSGIYSFRELKITSTGSISVQYFPRDDYGGSQRGMIGLYRGDGGKGSWGHLEGEWGGYGGLFGYDWIVRDDTSVTLGPHSAPPASQPEVLGGLAGGVIEIHATKITIDGILSADGKPGSDGGDGGTGCCGSAWSFNDDCGCPGHGGTGGGSGGMITIKSDILTGTGTISASGGDGGRGGRGHDDNDISLGEPGGNGGGGGGGSGGLITIDSKAMFISNLNISQRGGTGGLGGPAWTSNSGGSLQILEGKQGRNGHYEPVVYINPLCGQEGSEGYLARDGNNEFVCTLDENSEYENKNAGDYDSQNPWIYTKAGTGDSVSFFDLLNTYPLTINAGGENVDYDAWIGCGPPGINLGKLSEVQNPEAHIKNLYDIVYLSGEMSSSEQLETGSTTAEQNLKSQEVNLMDIYDYTIGTEEARGFDDAHNGITLSGARAPVWMCVKRNNIGFWAGCGANLAGEGTLPNPHNFFSGSMPTTFKDFGKNEIYSSTSLKPGSKHLYNRVLAMGIDQVEGEIYKEWLFDDFDPANYISDYFYNWNVYDNLEFYFYAVRRPEIFKLQIKYNKELDSTNPTLNEFNILNYSINGREEKRWHKIVIPISALSADSEKLKRISRIKIKADASDLDGFDADIRYARGGAWAAQGLYGLLFVDRFTLTSNSDGVAREYYCAFVDSGSDGDPDKYEWITDLNQNYQACNEQPGMTWTGQRCCGANGVESYNGGTNPTGEGYSCLNGEGVQEDTVVNIDIGS